MSRSVRRHPLYKYGCDVRESWRYCKKSLHRYNRRKIHLSLRRGDEYPIEALKLGHWGWDFFKVYYVFEKDEFVIENILRFIKAALKMNENP